MKQCQISGGYGACGIRGGYPGCLALPQCVRREDIGFSVLVKQGLAQYDAVLGLLSGGFVSPGRSGEMVAGTVGGGGECSAMLWKSIHPAVDAGASICRTSKPSRSYLQVPLRCACFWLCTCVRLVLVSRNDSVLAAV